MLRSAPAPNPLKPLALLLTLLVAPSCVDDDAIEEDLGTWTDPGPFETVEQGVSVGQVTGCSLAPVRGLDDQIIAEMNCMIPGVLVDFSDLNVVSGGSSTFFLLQPQAKEGLRRALNARGQRMTVNTAYRSIVQQYLLYRWYQSGQCGIGLAAAPGRSNHQSGLALDVSDNAGWRSSLQGNGWTWFGSSDAVHYDYTAGGTRDIRPTAIEAFQRVWNRHNPNDRIAEDGAYGPQTEARLRASPAEGFANNAPCGVQDNPTPQDTTFDINLSVRDLPGQARDLVTGGTSAGIFDALEGQPLVLDVTLRNGAGRPSTDPVLVGYDISAPGLRPTGYTIFTDHPARDGATWVVNDSNDNPDNPSHTAPAASGVFGLYRFGAGESKRIELHLSADAYTFGQGERPWARLWVKHIADYYGEQDGWDDAVEVNLRGELLRREARIDVFAADQWEFNGADPADVEGWVACNPAAVPELTLVEQALTLHVTGDDPHICGPAWVSIDADAYRSIALRVRHSAGAQQGQLFFHHGDDGFAEARSAHFTTRGDGAWEDVLVDLDDNAEWTGAIRGLRIDPFPTAPGGGATFAIDFIHPSTDAAPDGANNSTGNNGGANNNTPTPNNAAPNNSGATNNAGPDGENNAAPNNNSGAVNNGEAPPAAQPARVKDACSCVQVSGAAPPLHALWLTALLLGAALMIARRR